MITYDGMARDAQSKTFAFKGLSSDTKPTGSYDGYVIENGSSFMELDTKTLFYYNEGAQTWV